MSPKWNITKRDLTILGRNLILAIVGAILTVVSEWTLQVDWGWYKVPISYAVSGAVDLVQRWLQGYMLGDGWDRCCNRRGCRGYLARWRQDRGLGRSQG